MSADNHDSLTSITSTIDELSLRGSTSAQYDVGKYCRPELIGVAQSKPLDHEEDMWSDFIVPDCLPSSENVHSPPLPLLSPMWPEPPPLLSLANVNKAIMDCTGVIELDQSPPVDVFCCKTDSTKAALQMPPSEEWVFLLVISYYELSFP